MLNQRKIQVLKRYFKEKPEVVLAFLFGSYAKGKEMKESDVDIAIYLKEKDDGFEKENKIWSGVNKIIDNKEVDVVCLNEAPASLISNVFRTGIPLSIKNKKLYWELFLEKDSEAEDFLRFLEDFQRIKQRAKSLSKEDKTWLMIRVDFLKNEIAELEEFKKLSWEEYLEDRNKRRVIERWAENILNATIDIAKLILASEKKNPPKTYEEALSGLAILAGLTKKELEKFSNFARLRNILAHEYLDILYKRIQNFIKESPPIYKKVIDFLDEYLK